MGVPEWIGSSEAGIALVYVSAKQSRVRKGALRGAVILGFLFRGVATPIWFYELSGLAPSDGGSLQNPDAVVLAVTDVDLAV
jgi:hypothetical protein